MLRKAKESDSHTLAKIHLLEFDSYFLPSLGEKFLHLMYLNLIHHPHVSVWVVQSQSQIQGFVVGSRDFSSVFKQIIMKNFTRYVLLIIPQIVRKPYLLMNIIETILYPNKEGSNTPKTELVVIAVRKEYHRKGLGKNLVSALEQDLLSQKIKEYKVCVNEKKIIAKSFYVALGFKKKNDFSLYGEKISLFIKHIR